MGKKQLRGDLGGKTEKKGNGDQGVGSVRLITEGKPQKAEKKRGKKKKPRKKLADAGFGKTSTELRETISETGNPRVRHGTSSGDEKGGRKKGSSQNGTSARGTKDPGREGEIRESKDIQKRERAGKRKLDVGID